MGLNWSRWSACSKKPAFLSLFSRKEIYFSHVNEKATPAHESICENFGWYKGEKRAMKSSFPRIWREPIDHSSNCYFCMVDPSKRRAGKNASAIMYLDLPSSIATVPHCPELPVPTLPERKQTFSEESRKSEEEVDVDYNFRGVAGEKLILPQTKRPQ
ncbi:uncharacterized protein LOC143249474 [Tachypleus tridentatus]|uniref:uncharacterized protein LOC143249474 n=1 Tax=Tachypleus tridentatus TaxID=6853 RepID=UPI003FD4709B